MRPWVRSYGESSTSTRSPGRMRMKFIRILPDTRASTLCPLLSSTRKKALGSGSTTTPSTSMASSLVDPIFSARSAFFFFLSDRLYPPGRLLGAKLTSFCATHGVRYIVHPRRGVCERENLKTVRRDGNCVFKVRRERPVCGHDRPLVGQGPDAKRSGVHHRLDRQPHAGLEDDAHALAAVVGHRRLLMQRLPYAMPYECAHDCVSLSLDKRLHCEADV